MKRCFSPDAFCSFTATPTSLTDKNLYSYCDNNPISRLDDDGYFWEAILIGALVGVAAQYVSDVVGNVISGKTGADIFTPTSSWRDYVAAGVSGAIAAIPGLGLAGTMYVGAVANVTGDLIRGDIETVGDLATSALIGAGANGIGFVASKSLAMAKVTQIENMSRSARKQYLCNNIFKNSHKYANVNLKTFAADPIKIVEESLFAFTKTGLYSSLSSTLVGAWVTQ